ncbi:response regulator [Conexibacter sp. W3-3-2]|uniref:DNA-binding response regulator n=1 Tax=Paraconexibacter algicola TaxID=2133960 RepID=A0A2T4UN40_9ACTN|nr:response regulator [Conexibacter sp. W3-3-2]PTL60653.1 DNA-binding response regulator [Paraconexibacter algicola]
MIADDEVLLRAGIARLLQDAGMTVVAETGDAEEAVELTAAHTPDVAILDVQMPPSLTDDGLRAAIRIRREHPDTTVLVLSQFLEEQYPLDLIGDDAEGVGYLLKTRVADVPSFVESVRRVASGGSALDPDVVALMVGRRRRDNPLDALTPRERDVLSLMAEGKSNHGIARSLEVTPAAVEKHITGLFGKLGLGDEPLQHRRVMAVLALLRSR